MTVNKLVVFMMASLLLTFSGPGHAVVELEQLSTELLQKRYKSLIAELRCPKCQNQNLAGSDSMIAQDLRREVRILLEEGKSDREIKDFLVARYGDFVLYRPPASGVTLWAWVLPVVLFGLGIIVIVVVVRNASSDVDDEDVIDEDRLGDPE